LNAHARAHRAHVAACLFASRARARGDSSSEATQSASHTGHTHACMSTRGSGDGSSRRWHAKGSSGGARFGSHRKEVCEGSQARLGSSRRARARVAAAWRSQSARGTHRRDASKAARYASAGSKRSSRARNAEVASGRTTRSAAGRGRKHSVRSDADAARARSNARASVATDARSDMSATSARDGVSPPPARHRRARDRRHSRGARAT